MELNKEIERRRTFAIIAHPDAGKTTLTEKLLLFGGAIHIAGAVKSNKIKRSASSDFMEIERQRGISVATSVMEFEYQGMHIIILDTPGHEDFAEDTYRTLSAVDSAIVVIDAAKGVETQTRKLMEVCRMRNTPIMAFINKMDRESKDPFDLLNELDKELKINTVPLTFPIGSGAKFKGVYNIYDQRLTLFDAIDKFRINSDSVVFTDLHSAALDQHIGGDASQKLREDVELLQGIYPAFDAATYHDCSVAPVFFGSALNNFGVRELLDTFCAIAPSPRATCTNLRTVEPSEPKMTGFVFKIHTNMDANHHDRIAFLKICSGIFERKKPYYHVRLDKHLRFSSVYSFLGSKKSIVDTAYPGDIVGLHDTGNFKIGDTLTENEQMMFKGIPSFSPERFRYIDNADPLKAKQLAKGIDQLTDEGMAQLFVNTYNNRKIIGTLGELQFEMIAYRLEHEYGAKCRWEHLGLYKTCWIASDNSEQLADFERRKYAYIGKDKHGRKVYFAESEFALQMAQEKFTDIRFYFTNEY